MKQASRPWAAAGSKVAMGMDRKQGRERSWSEAGPQLHTFLCCSGREVKAQKLETHPKAAFVLSKSLFKLCLMIPSD